MKKYLITLLLVLPVLSLGQITNLFSFQKLIITPYLISGQQYYTNQNYDSSLIIYSIPQYLDENFNFKIHDFIEYEMYLYLKLGKVNYYLGNPTKSIDFLNRSLDFPEITNNISIQAKCHYYLGLCHFRKHNYSNSLKYYLKSLKAFINLKGKNSYNEAYIYLNIGNIYVREGEYTIAIDYYNKSLNILQNKDSLKINKISIIKNNLGSIYYATGNIEKAKKSFLEAISLLEKDKKNINSDLGMYYNNVAGIFLFQEKYDSAELYYQKSIQLGEKILPKNHIKKVQTYLHLAIVNLYQKNYNSALNLVNASINKNSFFSDSLSLKLYDYESVIDYNLMTSSLSLKAQIFQALYEETGKQEYFLKANDSFCKLLTFTSKYIKNNELSEYSIFSDIVRDGINSALYFFSKSKSENRNEKLYQFIEFGKSIKLLNNIIESYAKVTANIPDSLIKLEKSLKQCITSNEIEIKKAYLKNINTPINDLDLLEERGILQDSLEKLIHYFEKNYDKYYDLKYNYSVVDHKKVISELQDSTAIIEYYCADTNLYILLLKKDTMKVHRISIYPLENLTKNHIKNIKFYNNYSLEGTGRELYNILFKTIENDLKNIKHLIIIPDEFLYYLPYESVIHNTSNNNQPLNFLIYNFEFSYQYSSSIWFYSNKRKSNSQNKAFKFLGIAPFASFNDNSLHKQLPYSKKEVNNINKMFIEKGFDSYVMFDSCLSKQEIIKMCSEYTHIHFATHGYFNTQNPELSSIILGNPVNCIDSLNENSEYSFYISDSYNLILNAEMIVLGSCKSGIGKQEIGEGLISLTRGFFYSGAQNVLYSIWDVDDHSTSLLFDHFYSCMLTGESPKTSLRKAKLKLLSMDKYSLAIFWSGFLLLSI